MKIEMVMIRNTTLEDKEEVLRVYAAAREIMRHSGNLNQWVNGYPDWELLEKDINNHNSYVMFDNDGIFAVFSFILGEDETYGYIEGKWLNDEPYGTIHRIASDGSHRGIMKKAISFCSKKTDNIRIDTHEDNKIMQHQLTRLGFEYCGTIYLLNGNPRRAYHKVFEKRAHV